MQASLEPMIRQHLLRYLDSHWSFDEFQDWLIDVMWRIGEDGDTRAAALANRIENRLAEFTSGYVDEARLRDALRALVPEGATAPVTATTQLAP